MKKHILAMMLCIVMALTLSTAAFAAAPADVAADAWYYDSVQFCIENGLMVGESDAAFHPAGILTRAQVVTILYRVEGEPALMNDNIFKDVAHGSWYEKAVVWAQGKGIVNGYPDGTFRPNDPITREQFATILYNYIKYKGVNPDTYTQDTNTLSYEDVFTISSWASSGMHFCIAAGLINGSDDGRLYPHSTATRAEAAAIICRLADIVDIANPQPETDPGVVGGWTVNTALSAAEMPEAAQAAFDKATEGLFGVKYVPVAYLGSQVVAGVNYAFLCKAAAVTAQPVTGLKVVKVYRDLSGNAEITDVKDVNIADCVDSESGVAFNPADFAGGWTVSEACGGDLDKNAYSAFHKAFDGLLGVSYTPLACLGTQVVAGTNYAILCKAAAVTAEPQTALAVAVVYFDLSGNAEILSISGFSVA